MRGLLAGAAAVLILLVFLPSPRAAVSTTPPRGERGKAIVVLVDRVSPRDFPSRETPFCSRLAAAWSSGLMLARSGDVPDGDLEGHGGEFVTLGRGARAAGSVDAGLSFDATESFDSSGESVTAGQLYRQYTGKRPRPGSTVCLGWQGVRESNEQSGSSDSIGLLGTSLGRGGVKVAVLGNEDGYGQPRRFAPLICCNDEGSVQVGEVSGNTVFRPGATGIVSTDYAGLEQSAAHLLTRADLLIIDTGETGRIDREQGNADPAYLEAERKRALERVDAFVAHLTAGLDLRKSVLILMSPGAPIESEREGDFLTPMIVAGGGFGRGLLTSSSTKRAGIVSNIDFLPTILDFFGVATPSSSVGTAMTTATTYGTFGSLRALSTQYRVWNRVRWPMVITYLVLAFLLLLLTAVCAASTRGYLKRVEPAGWLKGVIPPAATMLLAAPLSFLVVSAFTYHNYFFPVLFCVGFSVVAGGAAWLALRKRSLDPVTFLALLTVAVIVIDLFAGNRFMIFPLLGSGSLEGLRYFGLTNIAVGLLIGATVWGAAGTLRLASTRPRPGSPGVEGTKNGVGAREPAGPADARWRYAVFFGLIVVALVIGLGPLGANLGGFIIASGTFMLFGLGVTRRGLTRLRMFVAVPVVTAVGTLALVVEDALFFQTHASRSIRGGASSLVPIAGRKLAINVSQIRYLLIPALILIVAIIVVVLWMRRPGSIWETFWLTERARTAGLYALLIGAIFCLVFEDTGITMLGAIIIVSVLAACYYAATDGFPVIAWRAEDFTVAAPGPTPGG
jgi:hypothetical protein